MSTKAAIKLIYISGMGFIGNSIGKLLSITSRNDIQRTLIRGAGIATGVYAGIIIANDLEIMIENAIDEIEHNKDDEHMEVYNGRGEED